MKRNIQGRRQFWYFNFTGQRSNRVSQYHGHGMDKTSISIGKCKGMAAMKLPKLN